MIDIEKCRFHIDGPKPLFAHAGQIRLAGWCFDESSSEVPKVRLSIGEQTFLCESGMRRTDVGVAFPQFPQARRSGFLLETCIPLGRQLARLEFSEDGEDWAEATSLVICSEQARLMAEIETPSEEVAASSTVTVSGWALHPQQSIRKLWLQVGATSTECEFEHPRSRVAAMFPGVAQADRCGFMCRIAVGAHKAAITVKARLHDGSIVFARLGRTLSAPDEQLAVHVEEFDAQRAMLLAVHPAQAPKVSIIIAVYNQLGVTLSCLKAIERHTQDVPYEVIVVDDCSDSRTKEALERIRGLRLIRNATNRGFLENCNLAAGEAKGEYLLFLNNDTEVTPEWLSAMLRIFETRPDAGLVGAKLVYPDGRLQEAGGIIWCDASGANYGKWANPGKPQYNYVREVDYCSGACILTPKTLFDELGGFDRALVPAYYEDTDYAFKVRDAGRKVYYQPFATVIHHEGASCGTSTDTGVKSYQLVNQVKFRTKWQHCLALHPAGHTISQDLAKDRGLKRRVLVADARVLCPDQDSGSLRMLKLLLIFQQLGFKVTFLPGNKLHHSPYTEQMQELGFECVHAPYLGSFHDFLSERAGEFDVIVLSRMEMGQKMLDACHETAPSTPVIFDTVDLHFLRSRREAELAKSAAKREEAESVRRTELDIASRCDAVIVVSELEQAVLQQELPQSHVAIISNIHEVHEPVKPFAGRRDFVFIGGYEHPPNVDAMLWFCSEVMPYVAAELPQTRLHIIGSMMPPAIRGLAAKNIVVHGYVEDVEPFFQSCVLSVAPLRYGAGVKGKINQSMSYGVPVVSTAIGAEGMHATHGEDILLADDAAAFAKHVVSLHRDQALWERLSRNSLRNIQDHFSVEVAKRNLHQLLADLDVMEAPPGRTSRSSRNQRASSAPSTTARNVW